jgi:hypothetical protein
MAHLTVGVPGLKLTSMTNILTILRIYPSGEHPHGDQTSSAPPIAATRLEKKMVPRSFTALPATSRKDRRTPTSAFIMPSTTLGERR